MLSIFSCTCWPFVYILWKNVYSGPQPIFKLDFFFFAVECMSSLYTSDVNLLADMCFASIFSYFIGCLFILLIFFFFTVLLGSYPKNHLFPPLFSSKSFMVRS